jgi:CheY-like chemotaxis protein
MTASTSNLPLVLIADDEPDVRHFLGMVIRRFGGEPLAVADGAAAVAAVTSQPRAFAAVILDQRMPQLTGVEAAVAIRALAVALPIVVSSGYLSYEELAILEQLPLTTLLDKPYVLRDLCAVLLPKLELAAPSAVGAYIS